MDNDDLKIVVSTVLEADEAASAQRIISQLPKIQSLVNASNSIKIQVGISSANIQQQTKQIGQQINQNLLNQQVGINLSLNKSSVENLKLQLASIGVGNDTFIDALTNQIDNMGVHIDSISHNWELVSSTEENLLKLTINGTDQLGRTVTLVTSYKDGMDSVSSMTQTVTENIKAQEKAVQAAAEAERKAEQQKLDFLQKQQVLVNNIQSASTGATTTKPLLETAHIDDVKAKYDELIAKINQYSTATGGITSEQKREIQTMVSSLDSLVKQYKNLEYAATSLRTKSVGQIQVEQGQELSAYKEKLESLGILTTEFKAQIHTLGQELSKVFVTRDVTGFLNDFDQLKSKVKAFQEQINSLDQQYKLLTQNQNSLFAVQGKMAGFDVGSAEWEALNQEAQIYESNIDSINAKIQEQLTAYPGLVNYSSQYAINLQNAEINEAKAAQAAAELSERANAAAAESGKLSVSISAVEAKFRNLENPTDELKAKVENLRTLFAEFSSADTDQKKVAAYEKLKTEISGCNTQMSKLSQAGRQDIISSTLPDKIAKARAELEALGIKWSALKKDSGLNNQFQLLLTNLNKVQSTGDLSKWNAQFASFKAQVKAAGKDVQSFGDILKNNISKVSQWITATTAVFRLFQALKTGVQTVIDLNTAMLDLRKTTDATEAEYAAFYKTANDTAKALGVTTEEIISQTAEWSRLGYSMQEAATLAENSAIFAAISPEMDIDEATDGLVSILKAFDIDVGDSLDGIISKINIVGNEFAVTNDDIVVALEKSSAAMAAANNSMEETVALATAATEITRDASTVGNAMKTVSMRIRSIDEETEELSDDLVNVSGVLADLTKTASNSTGVRVFEVGDPDTYRSTYEILKSVSQVWDEISDKNQAEVLELLFGKRQSQVGAAILSNFSQAEAALEAMEGSAGNAMEEFDIVTQTLEYRINALGQTWVGVAQDLIEDDTVADVVSFLQALSDAVAFLTENLGLLGTVGIAGAIVHMSKWTTAIMETRNEVSSVAVALESLNFETDGIAGYAAAISNLSVSGQKAALSLTGLTAEQKEQVLHNATLISSMEGLTVAELARAINVDKATLATRLNANETEKLTAATIAQAIASGSLSSEEIKLIAKTYGLSTAANSASLSTTGLATAIKSLGASMLATPFGWISLVITLIPTAISLLKKLYDALNVTKEEAYSAAEEHISSAEELQTELESLEESLKENRDRIKELQDLSNSGTITLVEQEELDDLIETNKQLDLEIEKKLKLQEIEDTAAKQALEQAYSTKSDEYKTGASYGMRLKYGEAYGSDKEAIIEGKKTADEYYQYWMNVFESLNSKKAKGVELSEEESTALEDARKYLLQFSNSLQEDYIDKYAGEGDAKDKWQGIVDEIDAALYPAEYFTSKISELPTAVATQLESLGEEGALTGAKVLELATSCDELNSLMTQTGYTADEVAAHFNAAAKSTQAASDSISDVDAALQKLKSGNAEDAAEAVQILTERLASGDASGIQTLSDALQGLNDGIEETKDRYDLIATAQEEMAEDGSLSYDTINKIMAYTDDYVNLLYEENGVIKLNTEAANEFTEAMVQADLQDAKIQLALLEQQRQEILNNMNDPYYSGGTYMVDLQDLESQISSTSYTISLYEGYLYAASGAQEDAADTAMDAAEAIESFNTAVDDSYSAFSDGVSSIQSINQAIEDYGSKTVLTADETAALINKFPSLVSQLTKTEDGYVLNSNALEDLKTAEINESTIMIQAEQQKAAAIMNSTTGILGSLGLQIEGFATAAEAMSAYVTAATSVAGGLKTGQYKAIDELMAQGFIYNEATGELTNGVISKVLDQNGQNYIEALNMTESYFDMDELINKIKELGTGLGTGSSTGSSSSSSGSSSSTTDIRDAMLTAIKETLEDADHQIFLWEKQGGQEEAIIAKYQAMQEAVHDMADQYRAMGEGEDSEYVQEMQTLWWGYQDSIEDVNEQITKSAEDAKQAVIDAFNTEIENDKFDISILEQNGADGREIVASWRDILDKINAEIDRYTAEGYDTTSDVIQSLMQEAWSAEDEIESVLSEMVSSASSAVDEAQSLYDTLISAAEEYASSNYLSVDTVQSLLDLGPEYLAYLVDENGQLAISEDRVKALVAARTEQYAVETAIAYVEALATAKAKNRTEELERLLYATDAATNANWLYVSSMLAASGLSADEQDAALKVINGIKSLSESAITSIGAVADEASDKLDVLEDELDELESMQDGLNDILDLTMDMVQDMVEQEIDGIEELKDQYAELIDAKKESLQATKDEDDYEKSKANKIKSIAKLQEQIDLLSLDDSREAQAERASLQEEMAELQEELAEDQADYALDKTLDSLDEMKEAYEDEKDEEIEILEDSISSTQKIYDLAIQYIDEHWDTLYNDLISWNYEYGNQLQDDVVDKWNQAYAAAQKYGDYITALKSIEADITATQEEIDKANESSGSSYVTNSSGNKVVANTTSEKVTVVANEPSEISTADTISNNESAVKEIVSTMKANAAKWTELSTQGDSTKAARNLLADRNIELGNSLSAYGVDAYRDEATGVWYVNTKDGKKKLFDIYHSGGVVGGGTLKSDEQLALLKHKEWVLTADAANNLSLMLDGMVTMMEKLNTISKLAPSYTQGANDTAKWLASTLPTTGDTISTVNRVVNNNNQSTRGGATIYFGDTSITCKDNEIAQYVENITRDNLNQIAKQLGLKL